MSYQVYIFFVRRYVDIHVMIFALAKKMPAAGFRSYLLRFLDHTLWCLWLRKGPCFFLCSDIARKNSAWVAGGWQLHRVTAGVGLLASSVPVVDCLISGAEQIEQDRKWFGYGSIPIHTIFRGMNIHLPAILMFTRGTRFWHTAIWENDHIIPTTSQQRSEAQKKNTESLGISGLCYAWA
jgi:hypothetical protein